MNILYITPYVPSCIRTRPYNLIRALARQEHRITLLTAAETSEEEQAHIDELTACGIQVEAFPVSLPRSLGNCLRALPSSEPLQAVYSYHPRMERRLRNLLSQEAFDVVHVEHLRAARLVRAVTRTPAVYDSVDCISLLFEQAARDGAQLRSRLMTAVDLGRTRRYEARLLTRYNQVIVTSQRDKDALERLAQEYLPLEAQPAPITVVTNGVDLDYFQSTETGSFGKNPVSPPTVVFTGKMSYHANVAAALYFARDVMPRIWAQHPEVRFQIVGKDPPDTIRTLATDQRIEVTGTVPDLRPYLAQATVAVCPALYAVGIQNKVLEAMAMGAPVVSTSAGCAALESEQGNEVIVADGEDALATAVLRVISNPDMAQSLSEAGRRYVEIYHSWDAAARQLAGIYEQ
jgi:sugar transferase (PEP-CTERM/EpsH1 system associated)